MDNLLYNMKLHDILNFNDFTVIRVPGGWIYIQHCGTTFVPFNNEFQREG